MSENACKVVLAIISFLAAVVPTAITTYEKITLAEIAASNANVDTKKQ